MRGGKLDPSVLILLGVAAVLLVLAVIRGGAPLAVSGVQSGAGLLLAVLPQLLIGFALAGLAMVLLPSEILGRYVGPESGLGGLAIATVAGMATPGGPFVQFPLVAALANAGAGTGPMAAFITAWSLISWNRIVVYELPLLGTNFTLARWSVSLLVPILVGALVPFAFRAFQR